MSALSLSAGSEVSLTAVAVSLPQYTEVWEYRVKVLQTTDRAVKLGAKGTNNYLWLPKKAVKADGELTSWGFEKMRSSYIARSALHDVAQCGI